MNFDRKQTVVVLCSSEETREHWSMRSKLYDDLDLELLYPASQAWQIVKNLINRHDRPVIVCQDFVWLGAGFGQAVDALERQLSDRVPKWGVCGNRGGSWDGELAYDYTRDAETPGGVRTAYDVRPVLTLDDNLVLLNCTELRKCELVDLGSVGSLIFGIPLSLECLRYGLPLLVSPHLFTLRSAHHSESEISALTTSSEFRNYYSQHFFNHFLPWPDGQLDLQNSVDYEYVARPDKEIPQRDVLQLFDRTLIAGRTRPPSLTLCCRTQFTRPELLRRAITSFAVAQTEARALLDLRVCLVSDRDVSTSEAYLGAYRQEFPLLELECWHHIIRSRRYSRADLLIAAIERATTDYIWFVDDDDYVLPGAIEALSRTLQPEQPVITVANSLKVRETWSTPEGSGQWREMTLASNRLVGRFYARDIFRVFAGQNFVPVCSVMLPVGLTATRLKEKHALGDYNEDYFILLTALTAAQIEVRVLDIDICGVSLRETGNTVTEGDRSNWNFSYATFMHEILSADDRNPIIWQLGNTTVSS